MEKTLTDKNEPNCRWCREKDINCQPAVLWWVNLLWLVKNLWSAVVFIRTKKIEKKNFGKTPAGSSCVSYFRNCRQLGCVGSVRGWTVSLQSISKACLPTSCWSRAYYSSRNPIFAREILVRPIATEGAKPFSCEDIEQHGTHTHARTHARTHAPLGVCRMNAAETSWGPCYICSTSEAFYDRGSS